MSQMNVEQLIQYLVVSAVLFVFGWVWRTAGMGLVGVLKERIALQNAERFKALADAFHEMLESRLIDMIQAELLDLAIDDSPEEIIENQQRIAGGVMVKLRKWLQGSKWGLMQQFAYSYIDEDNDYLVTLINTMIYNYITELYEDLRTNTPPSNEDDRDYGLGND